MIRRIISLFLTGVLISVLAVECTFLEFDIDYQDKSRSAPVVMFSQDG